MKHLFDGLNKAQEEAIRFKDGPLLVLAGPGSGKTRVVTHRIAWLLEQGVPDWQIVAMTFTNKAANEMNSRLSRLAPGARVWMGTFHKFCARLLRMHADKTRLGTNFTIYDTDQSRQLLANLIDKNSLPAGVDAQKIAGAISWAKNNLILPDDYVARAGSLLGKTVAEVYPQYQQALRDSNAVDFDDLLVRVAVMLKENPGLRHDLDARYRYLLLDEYQDTNLVQYAISRALSVDYPNLCVTGDPDQSIYGWRGANINNILDFEKDFPTVHVVRLEQNYRSTKSILAVASSLIKHNKHRKDKELFTDNADGPRPRVLTCFNQRDEAEIIAREIATAIAQGKRQAGDFAIFYRTNALSRNLEHALHRNGFPFQLVRGLEFFGRREIRDLVAYFQLIYNTSDSIAFRRVINLPARGIGRTTVGKLENYAATCGVSLFDAAACVDRIPGIAAKTRKSVSDFVAMINRFIQVAAEADLEVLLSIVLRDSKYLQSLMDAETEEDKERCANVQELLSEVREFDRDLADESAEKNDETNANNQSFDSLFESDDASGMTRLGRFLERTALVNDVDAWNNGADRVSLMTLHAAKGLEFPVVYIIAVEENILPHERSLKDEMQLEEERRLLFVGITRACEELLMSKCVYREFRGMYSAVISSRFLFEISPDSVETIDCIEQLPPEFEGRGTTQDVMFLSDHLDKLRRDQRPERDPFAELQSGGELRFDSDSGAAASPSSGKRKKKSNRVSASSDSLPEFLRDDSNQEELHRDSPPKSNEGEQTLVLDEEYQQEVRSVPDEIVFDADTTETVSSFETPRVKPERKKKTFIPPSAVTIATDLLSSKETPQSQNETTQRQIVANTMVRHPDYGVGVVKGIQGPSSDRIATVEFFSGVGTVDIPLSDPQLSVLKTR